MRLHTLLYEDGYSDHILQLAKRKAAKESAVKSLEEAKEAGEQSEGLLVHLSLRCYRSHAYVVESPPRCGVAHAIAGNMEDIERFSKRTVRMERYHITDCMKLLTLMGMPVVEAPCEVRGKRGVRGNVPAMLLTAYVMR